MSQPPSNSINDWLAALSAPVTEEVPGDDWLTREQIELLIGRRRFATQQYLAAAIKKGTVEKKLFQVRRSDGNQYSKPHYRVIK